MKKTLLITTIICGMMAAGTAFAQHTQSMSFTLPGGTVYQQNDTFTLNSFVTFAGYNSVGMSYWLEVAGGTQNFFHITAETFMTFPDPTQPGWPNEFNFPMMNGVDAGMFATSNDLGGTTSPPNVVTPGTYQVSQITLSITGAALGTYTFFTTTTNPRPSVVSDTNFMDNNLPQASFTITIVPEPSTFALLALAGAGVGLLVYRRRRAATR